MNQKKSVFDTLFAVNVNGHTEKKKSGSTELTYLSWPFAWAEVKKAYPDATYEVVKQANGQPYTFDENTGYMVNTRVSIEGVTHEMWLPVMDGANKAMKDTEYTYLVKNPNFKYAQKCDDGVYRDKYGNEQRQYIEKRVEPASMFDVNKAIMRCLVKNMAMFGLGLYIYAGEDLPQVEKSEALDSGTEDVSQAKQNSNEQMDAINKKNNKDSETNDIAERLAARALCQQAVKKYCQQKNADEKEAWKIIADTIGKPSKEFTKEDWERGRQIAEAWNT